MLEGDILADHGRGEGVLGWVYTPVWLGLSCTSCTYRRVCVCEGLRGLTLWYDEGEV